MSSGPQEGWSPLMTVLQENKQKVRPVMDYRELNKHVDLHTAGADICAHKLREWWQQGSDVAILDLRRTYLQLRVEKSLWPFQTVEIKGTRYCLTRQGFGLNVALSIMTAIMSAIRQQDEAVWQATLSYIDNIFVNESILFAQVVKKHFESFGLTCKDPERLRDGAKVLGLRVSGSEEGLRWRRGGDVPGVSVQRHASERFLCLQKAGGPLPCVWLAQGCGYKTTCNISIVGVGRWGARCRPTEHADGNCGQGNSWRPCTRELVRWWEQVHGLGGCQFARPRSCSCGWRIHHWRRLLTSSGEWF